MGNRQTKAQRGPAYRYQVHGIQYLEESPARPARAQSQGLAAKQRTAAALYVSNDWTASVNDTGSLAGIDWLNAQYPYENIVMSGGGSKGYAFIGALKALEDAGILQNIRRVAGSSAGAICAGLIAVGCTPQEIADVFKGDIKWLFQDQKCMGCCCIPKLFTNYGVHPGQRFFRIYGQHLANKTGDPDITFAQLHERYGRELCIVVTNLSKMCSEYCTHRNTPDLPVRQAVRMSMSFPMVYEAVKCEINGQTSLYTDGGTLDQFPVHCFDDKRLDLNHNSKLPPEKEKMNKKTIGIYVVSESAIDYKIWNALFGCKIPYKPTYLPDSKLARSRLAIELEKRKRKDRDLTMKDFLAELRAEERIHDEPMFHYETCDRSTVDIRNFKDYFVTTIETLLISQRKLHIKPHDAARTVAVNCGYIGTNDYVIEPADREFMLRQGYEHTEQFLKEFLKKARGDMRLDASLTSQVIREVSAQRESLAEDVLAVTQVNLTQSSLRYMDDTLDDTLGSTHALHNLPWQHDLSASNAPYPGPQADQSRDSSSGIHHRHKDMRQDSTRVSQARVSHNEAHDASAHVIQSSVGQTRVPHSGAHDASAPAIQSRVSQTRVPHSGAHDASAPANQPPAPDQHLPLNNPPSYNSELNSDNASQEIGVPEHVDLVQGTDGCEYELSGSESGYMSRAVTEESNCQVTMAVEVHDWRSHADSTDAQYHSSDSLDSRHHSTSCDKQAVLARKRDIEGAVRYGSCSPLSSPVSSPSSAVPSETSASQSVPAPVTTRSSAVHSAPAHGPSTHTVSNVDPMVQQSARPHTNDSHASIGNQLPVFMSNSGDNFVSRTPMTDTNNPSSKPVSTRILNGHPKSHSKRKPHSIHIELPSSQSDQLSFLSPPAEQKQKRSFFHSKSKKESERRASLQNSPPKPPRLSNGAVVREPVQYAASATAGDVNIRVLAAPRVAAPPSRPSLETTV